MPEGGGGTLNYRGSIATLFYNRQDVGTNNSTPTEYDAPTRTFNIPPEHNSPPARR